MVFVAFCHTFDNNNVKGKLILFAMNNKVMIVSWGKTSQYFYSWIPVLSVSAKNFLGQVQSRSDGVCVFLPSTLRYLCEE